MRSTRVYSCDHFREKFYAALICKRLVQDYLIDTLSLVVTFLRFVNFHIFFLSPPSYMQASSVSQSFSVIRSNAYSLFFCFVFLLFRFICLFIFSHVCKCSQLCYCRACVRQTREMFFLYRPRANISLALGPLASALLPQFSIYLKIVRECSRVVVVFFFFSVRLFQVLVCRIGCCPLRLAKNFKSCSMRFIQTFRPSNLPAYQRFNGALSFRFFCSPIFAHQPSVSQSSRAHACKQ